MVCAQVAGDKEGRVLQACTGVTLGLAKVGVEEEFVGRVGGGGKGDVRP